MKKSEGYISPSGVDEHCWITCVCKDAVDVGEISLSPYCVTRCPKCNRGYRTEFVVYIYAPDEVDPEILDRDEWNLRYGNSKKTLEELKNFKEELENENLNNNP